MRNRKGFTLIELLIVVVIIGILAAIAIPKFGATKNKAYLAAMKSDLRNLVTAEESYFADNVTYTNTLLTTVFSPSAAVTVVITGASGSGWAATAKHAALSSGLQTCGIFGGDGASPNAAVTTQSQVGCW